MIDVADLDSGSTLSLLEDALRQRRAAEVAELELACHWADLHAEDPRSWPVQEQYVSMPRLVQVGGPGTPRVQDHALAEFAIVRQCHTLAARSLTADALDLRHRLPRCYRVLRDGQGEAWVARKIAALTRAAELTAAEAGMVDRALAPCLGTEQPSRILSIAEAKIIEADPEKHRARVEADRARRYVTLSRADETGLRHVIARVEAGDAVWINAMVDRVADILTARHPDEPRDALRARAFAWLARPAELLTLLLEHIEPDETEPESGEPGEPGESATSRALAFPADLLDALRSHDPAKLRPQATLYLHLHVEAVTGGSGVLRVEGGRPLLPEHLTRLVADAHVTVTPVIDLADQVSVNSYEHPQRLKDRSLLRTPGDVFPHAAGVSRCVDHDHTEAYRFDGPAGQTGMHNTGPLSRFHHRIKTHARGFVVSQPHPGEFLWVTPHGRYRYVDHHGTHVIGPKVAEALTSSCTFERHYARILIHTKSRT